MVDMSRYESRGERPSVRDELRRQMEEMLRGGRRPTPTVIRETETTRRGGAMGEGEHTGFAMAAFVGYWALPLIARRKRRKRRRRARPDAQS
jgi:hypothetical protein